MKVLSIAVPSYNSEAYMKKTIDHLVLGGDDVEVLVIDDGSKDNTLAIAKEYESRFPGIVRAIHQENKGHGGAVNTGIREASGVYFKVCDSDDYYEYDAYMKLLDVLRTQIEKKEEPDIVITNYVYDKQGAKHKKVMKYTGRFPENQVFTWNDIKRPLSMSQYVLMHSLTYKLQLLRENNTVLPEHCFYVDTEYICYALSFVKTAEVLDYVVYQYRVGNPEQSVSWNNII